MRKCMACMRDEHFACIVCDCKCQQDNEMAECEICGFYEILEIMVRLDENVLVDPACWGMWRMENMGEENAYEEEPAS